MSDIDRHSLIRSLTLKLARQATNSTQVFSPVLTLGTYLIEFHECCSAASGDASLLTDSLAMMIATRRSPCQSAVRSASTLFDSCSGSVSCCSEACR